MRGVIINKLKDIEQAENIQILFACESGSRGWGFPSPDSDYDVRFIYLRPLDHYLSVSKKNDELKFPINDELDINGWDIHKALGLITKSNTTPFEWLQSPILYIENENFRKEVWKFCQSYFCIRSNVFHYLGIARSALSTMQGDDIKIKKLFYVLRPLLAAIWCVEKKSIAPMDMARLQVLLPEELRTKTDSLISLKSTVKESYTIKPENTFLEWINTSFEKCTDAVAQIEKLHFDTCLADEFFKKMVMGYDNTRY